MKAQGSYAIYIMLLLVIVFIGLLVWGNLPFLEPVRSALGLSPKVTGGEVVNQLRAASYLTTTKYAIKVIATDKQTGNWYLLGLDRYTVYLSGKGIVKAGIDLSKVTPADVVVSADGKNVTVTLPPVSIHRRESSLSSNEDDTKAYDLDSGPVPVPQDVQQRLRNTASDALVKSACKAGIMQRATLDAQIATEELLKTLLPNAKVTVLSGPIPSVKECTTAE